MGFGGMLTMFVVGFVVVIAIYLVGRGVISVDLRLLARILRVAMLSLSALVMLALIVSGMLGIALTVLGLLASLLLNHKVLWRRFKASRGPSAGKSSGIETSYLRMTLDHDSGALSGEVLAGSLQGCRLDQLRPEDLRRLHEECRQADPRSATVLEAYLDRTQPPGWRSTQDSEEPGAKAGTAAAGAGGAMTTDEAYQVLGLEPGATPEAIKDSHRRLMVKFHPDHGGTSYLAAKINRARDVLLKL
ncbi:MAG: DnaJ domain-containing protein [Azospirillum sp.]|nr:DnaJ domain-containing protein [Azospirillum sp.]